MKSYVVRNGENIYDVALKLYGTIEGVYALLVTNQTAINGKPLTFETKLESGMILSYSDDYVINRALVDWFKDHDTDIRNGEHVYEYHDTTAEIIRHIEEYNQNLVDRASERWPGVCEDGHVIDQYDQQNADYFFRYINMYYIGCGADEVELAAKNYVSGHDYQPPSTDEINMWTETMVSPQVIIQQTGLFTHFETRIKAGGIMLIDWGDNTAPENHTYTQDTFEAEHNYLSSGQHTIIIYGSFVLDGLDLTELNGVYYPLAPITVEGEFKSPLINAQSINNLISNE